LQQLKECGVIKYKYKQDEKLFYCLHPVLIYLFLSVVKPVIESQGIDDITITRTCGDMIDGVSKTDIHSSGRAIDIRTKDWFADLPEDVATAKKMRIQKKLNMLLSEKFGAISSSTHERVFAYYHIGTAEHLHIQIGSLKETYLLED
jgi:hypothetical protein